MSLTKYEVSDSEDNYSDEDRILLEEARKSMTKQDVSSDEELYGFDESESEEEEGENEQGEEEEEEENDIDMGSDIEDEEKAPDDRAWGKRKKSFYSTDFVDQDYEGIYQGEEAEIAELEEQEARNIQKRLVEQLNEADFSISEAIDIAETTEGVAKKETIESDLSKLTKRQKLDLVKKESPEFFALIDDFKEKILEAKKFLPVINYFKSQVKQSFPALEYLQTKLTVILNYCTNISFYLFLKAKRIPIKNHPVLKNLFRFRQLLQQMDEIDGKVMKPQLDKIIKMIEDGKEVPIEESLLKKKKLKVLSMKKEAKEIKKVKFEEELNDKNVGNGVDADEQMEEEEEDTGKEGDDKRAITYEMAKNKGLTPKRSKEQRNPRVKHRKKYEKAKIRRKGQVRLPRTEIPVYGGELTGIKIGVTKSIKIK